MSWVSLPLVLASLAAGSPARAEPPPAACAEAYVDGQHLLREHHLGRAREALLLCARSPCPRTLQPECTQWLAEVERAMPTVVLDARAADGAQLRGVRFTVDGAPRSDLLDGTARELDPGDHVARAEAEGYPPATVPFVAREGEKNRLVVVTMGTAAVAPLSPRDAELRGSYLPAVVAGGAAVAGLAVFTGFAIGALDVHSDLTTEGCSPHCSSARVDTGKTDEVVADVGLGVAAASLGLATYFFLHARSTAPSSSSALRFGAAPEVSARGARTWLEVAF